VPVARCQHRQAGQPEQRQIDVVHRRHLVTPGHGQQRVTRLQGQGGAWLDTVFFQWHGVMIRLAAAKRRLVTP